MSAQPGSAPIEFAPPESVLVTGASTGIGRASVAALVADGYHVWATVRSTADADSLTAEHGSAVTPLLLDLLDHASVRSAGERVCAAGPLRALVNNAGVAVPSPLEFLPIEAFERQLAVNLVGQLLMTQVLLPALLAHGDGRILFIGSVSGRIAGPMLGAYAASKHGIVGLASSLRAELAPYGVRVSLIEPGVIATPIWASAAQVGEELMSAIPAGHPRYAAQLRQARASLRNGETGLPAAAVARVVLRAVRSRRPSPRQVVGRDGLLVAALTRLLPFRVVYRLTAGRP